MEDPEPTNDLAAKFAWKKPTLFEATREIHCPQCQEQKQEKTPKWGLGGGFKYFLFSPLFGEDSQFDEHIFQMGWFNHQPGNQNRTLEKIHG